jgi:ubiquitin-activating enzyme E1
MGVEAVAKQAAANIFVSGAGALGIEISKNLVLSGCKSFTLHDSQPVTQRDLSGQFFLNLAEGKTRSEVCLPRLQQLNFYVRCKLAPTTPIPLDPAEYEKEPWNFQGIDVFILTEADYSTVTALDNYCRAKGKKFIYADLKGVFGRLFNDFGESFEVLDKNGEELQDCMIKSITNDEEAVVTLLDTNKHNLEDGDEIMFTAV